MEVKNLPAVVHPKVIVSPHPISASIGRTLFYNEFLPGESLGAYFDRLDLMPAVPGNFILTVSGVRVAFDLIDKIYPRHGDLIIMRAWVHGGGDDGGSDPVRVALIIAVLAASQGTAAAWVGMMTGTSMAVGSAVVLIGGMLLISALIPVKVPSFDDSQPSPTYALTGSANRARPYEPLPLVFGTVRMYPDHGARPFTEYIGRDQLLIQVFNFGLSDVSYTDMKIGETLLSLFDDATTEESVDFTGVLDDFPGNVDSLAGANLVDNAGTFITRTSSIDTTRLVVDVSGVSYFVGREEGLTFARVTLVGEYSVKDAGVWLPFFRGQLGGDTTEVDIVNGDKETIRLSYSRIVTKGQYDVRIQLKDLADVVYYTTSCDKDGLNCTKVTTYSGRGLNNGGMTQFLSFDQLKSYQPDESDYTNQKRLALSIKANAQLSGRIDAFNVIASAKVLVWTDPTWTNQVSSNPAWQFLSLVKGKFDGTRRLYGAGLPDSRIDIETIKTWGQWCTDKGLECNIVFDAKMTVIDMLNTIARCGRATTTWSNGTIGVVFDEANKVATAVFGMSNIILDSFQVNYITNNQVDEVIVAFVNPDIAWQRDTVRATVPGVTSPINAVTIDLPGVTSLVQAGREANLIAAEQFYRRRIITWETDMEGLTVTRGEVGILSHDVTQWDYSGRLVSGTVDTLALDRDVTFTPATQHYVGVKSPDGTYVIVDVDILVGDHNTITLTTPLASAPNDDVNNEVIDYMWFFGPKATPGKLVKITDITPLSQDRVRIVATDEEDDFYLAESNTYVYVTPGSFIDGIPTISGLTLGESLVIVGSGFGSQVNVSWAVAGEYGGAFVRAGDEDTPIRDIGRTLDTSFSFEWATGKTVTVEVVTYNLNFESSDISADSASILLVGKAALPSDVTNFSAVQNGQAVVLRWSQPPDIDLAGTEIRYGACAVCTWENATPLTEVTKGTNITSQALPDGDWTIFAKHRDTSLNYSANAVSVDLLFDTAQDIITQVEQAPDWPSYYGLTVTDNSIIEFTDISQTIPGIDGTKQHQLTALIEKDAIDRATRFPMVRMQFDGSVSSFGDAVMDTSTGESSFTSIASGTFVSFDATHWLLTMNVTSADTANDALSVRFFPAVGASVTWIYNATATGTSSFKNMNAIEVSTTTNLLSPTIWTGSSNFVLHHTGKLVPLSQDADSTDGGTILWAEDTVFEIFVNNPFAICEYTAPEIDIGFDDVVRIWGDIQSHLGPGGLGVANPLLEVDYKLAAGSYDGFESWTIGDAELRYTKHKLVLDTAVGVAAITGFNPTVDQLEHTTIEQFTIGAGGTTVVYANPFHAVPWGSAAAISSTALFATISSITATQALVHVYNTSGTSVGGEAVVTLTGV